MNQTPSILLVEDDAILKEMYQISLEKAGFKMTAVDTGEDALTVIENHAFDLVLLDIMLPKISGLDVLQKLREGEATKDLPIVILSALGTDEDKMRAKELGATDYLTKSETTPKDMTERIKEILHAN